jgi:DNA modification methylase
MVDETVTIGGATLYLGDCVDVLRDLKKNAPGCWSGVQCFVTSPPYNQNLQNFRPSGMHKETNWVTRISSAYYDTMDEDEYEDWQLEVLDCCHDVASGNASFFYNHKVRWRDKVPLFPLDIVRPSKWAIRQEIIWARDGSVTQNAKMFPPSDERIFWLYKNDWKWNRANTTWMSVWRINSEAGSDHPVAYPVEIPNRAIACTSDPGDVVLDPFMGSGTTGVACANLGRKFIGIEIERKYFDIACERIAAAYAQGRLFA